MGAAPGDLVFLAAQSATPGPGTWTRPSARWPAPSPRSPKARRCASTCSNERHERHVAGLLAGRRQPAARAAAPHSRPTTPGAATTAPSSSPARAPRRRCWRSTSTTTPGAASTRPSISTTRCRRRWPRLLGVPHRTVDMILEGGSIEVNGAGTLLTTEQCLLNPNRNPRLTRAEIERRLRENLGVRADPLARRGHRRRRHRRPRRRPHAVRRRGHGRDRGRGRPGRRELRAAAGEPASGWRRCGCRTAGR